ncbi:MAG: thiol reductant ABC exporter subunit CydC [Pseudonocardiaceae bacterium]
MIADLRWVLYHSRPAACRLLLAALAAAGALGSAVALIATSAWLIATAALHPPVFTLTFAVVAVRAFGLARGALRYTERLVSHDAALRVLTSLRVGVYQQLERLTPAGLGSTRTGDVLSRVVSDVDAVGDLLLRVLLPGAAAGLVTAGTVGLLAVLRPAAALVVGAAALACAVVVPVLTTWWASRAEGDLAAARGELTAEVVDLLQGGAEVLAYGAAGRRLRSVAGRDAALTALLRRAAGSAGAGTGLSLLGCAVAVVGCLLVSVPGLDDGVLTGPELAVVVLTPLALWEALAALPPALQRLPGLAAAAGRLRALETIPAPVGEPALSIELPAGPGQLRADGLGLRWPGTGYDVVTGLNLELTTARCVALVGPSGCGKSTVVAALLRFLDPSAGMLTLDGVDVRQLDTAAVRSWIAWCGPHTQLFDTSVRENLLLARPEAGEDELLAVLAAARLRDWVLATSDGLDTLVGENGARLSGGERQRLGLARALLAERPVLVLDEPTAHLDRPTAVALGKDLARAAGARTTLLISHDPSLVGQAHSVVRLTGRCSGSARPRPT